MWCGVFRRFSPLTSQDSWILFFSCLFLNENNFVHIFSRLNDIQIIYWFYFFNFYSVVCRCFCWYSFGVDITNWKAVKQRDNSSGRERWTWVEKTLSDLFVFMNLQSILFLNWKFVPTESLQLRERPNEVKLVFNLIELKVAKKIVKCYRKRILREIITGFRDRLTANQRQ